MKMGITHSSARTRSMHWPHALKKDSINPTVQSSKFQSTPWVLFNLWWLFEYSTFPSKLVPLPVLFVTWLSPLCHWNLKFWCHCSLPRLQVLLILQILFIFLHLHCCSASSSSYHFVYFFS